MELYINLSRFHPLFVHLPIGILLFAFFMEGYQKWKKTTAFNPAINLALLTGCIAAVSSVLTGLALAKEGGYQTEALNLHKWMGIGLTVLSGLLFLAKTSSINWLSNSYQVLLFGVVLLLTITGHYGGNLTHGADYLFTDGKSQAITVTDIQTANVYETIIQPILKDKCNGCHNPSKAKGDLIMTTQAGILKGGKNGNIFNFEQPEKSDFLVRVHLPMEDEEHMPPDGKKQLDEDEITLLTWWIENKACFDCLVQDTKGKETVSELLKRYETSESNLNAINATPIAPEKLAKLQQAGIAIQPLSETSPLVFVDLANHKDIDKSLLKKLKGIGENIVDLNLSNSNFSDAHAAIFKSLPHLQRLQLQQTAITDKTVAKLNRLAHLETLNLYNTAVTDASLLSLSKIKTLKKLYTWQSKITNDAMANFQKSRPLLQVQHQLDEEIFGKSELLPPTIVSENQLFTDSVAITFEINFRNTTVYYTLDGSDPDSTSAIFKDSIILKSSAKIKAYVAKEGWGNSGIATKQFIRTSQKITRATLDTPPNESYKGSGAKTLIDLEKGTDSFKDGNWLGYQGEHFTATLVLEKSTNIQSVFISALAAPGAWIFYPQGFTVSVSEDGRNFETIYDKMEPPLKEDLEVGMKYFDIHFPTTSAKYVKVKVHSLLQNPAWHPAPGESCWVFVDEIMLD